MVDIILTLKHHARRFHRQLAHGNAMDFDRLNRHLPRAITEPGHVRRRDCLAMLARELGFRGWSHLLAVMRDREVRDFGKILYPGNCCAHINIWSASHEEARRIRADSAGFLLGYGRQYLIVDRDYIRTLGLDPDDPDWRSLEWDLTGSTDIAARSRLIGRLIRQSLGRRSLAPQSRAPQSLPAAG